MKNDRAVARELKRVRVLLAEYRETDPEHDLLDMLYGAQQALIWVQGVGASPSELNDTINRVALELEQA